MTQWTKTERDMLAQMCKDGVPARVIAAELGRSTDAIHHKIRLWGVPYPARDGVWTNERIKNLEQMWAEGASVIAIGRALGVSKHAVCGKRDRLGLPKRQTSIPPKKQQRPATMGAPLPAGARTLPPLPSELAAQ